MRNAEDRLEKGALALVAVEPCRGGLGQGIRVPADLHDPYFALRSPSTFTPGFRVTAPP